MRNKEIIMKISGFTIARNVIKYDYPIIESINSILPICDEFVVAVGNSEDDTLGLIQSIKNSKIKIIETVWDDSLRTGGRVLAMETDKAFKAVSEDSDWAFYIQADEIIHEKYLETIKIDAQKHLQNMKVDGLLFNYRHFYGSYDYYGSSTKWYRKEIRLIRNSKNIYSYRDAQGFRKDSNVKLNVKPSNAEVYHYGWVKEPAAMQRKQESFHKLWHDDNWMEKNVAKVTEFDYSEIDSLDIFTEEHPAVMKNRIESKNWKFDFDISKKNLSFKEKFRTTVEKLTGYRIAEYKNYKVV